ncbi:MAG: hypothetical protein U0X20_32740 [Caldilineaceae bacterium]
MLRPQPPGKCAALRSKADASVCAGGVMSAYHPAAVSGDKQLLAAQGWQACFTAVGVPLPQLSPSETEFL